jgi:2-keto-4-pentenoate hydratase/2-oxohepta-3-ene-1,7-dioic acid hydratase in catechol pathway
MTGRPWHHGWRSAPRRCEAGGVAGASFDPTACAAPLPRAYHWADGSAYVTHVELVRRARGTELPASFWEDPLVYMGASDAFIGARDPILVEDEAWGIDFEAEVVVVTDDVPAGVTAEQAAGHIRLIGLVNDVSCATSYPENWPSSSGSTSRNRGPRSRRCWRHRTNWAAPGTGTNCTCPCTRY